MLNRLLHLKAQRARRLRARLARLAHEDDRLTARAAAIERQRALLRADYDLLLQQTGVFDQRARARLRAELDAKRQAEHALRAEAAAVSQARQALAAERVQWQTRLQQVQRQQEKLGLMLACS
jgi:predicted  nucleic acid-binding Zn-ribbon protein